MSDRIANSLYPSGPSNRLGNERPEIDVDNMDENQRRLYENDEREFRLGDDKFKDQFIKRYGLEHAVEVLDMEIEKSKALEGGPTGGAQYLKDLKIWRHRLDIRLNPEKEPIS